MLWLEAEPIVRFFLRYMKDLDSFGDTENDKSIDFGVGAEQQLQTLPIACDLRSPLVIHT